MRKPPLRSGNGRWTAWARRGRMPKLFVERLEDRTVPDATPLASIANQVSFETAQQSMWGSNGPAIIDTGKLFAGASWDLSAHPTLGSEAANNFISLDAATSGNIGVDFRAALDPGSVDASFASQAGLQVIAGAGDTFTIQSTMIGSPTGNLVTRSPNVDIESNFVFDVAASLGVHGEFGTPDLTITVPTVTFQTRHIDLGFLGSYDVQVPVFGTKQVTIPGLSYAFNEPIVALDVNGSLQLLKVTNHQISVLEQNLATADPGQNLSFNFDLGFDPLTGLDVSIIDESNPKKDEKPHDTSPFDVGVSFSMGDITVDVPTLNLQQDTFSNVNGSPGLQAGGATNLAQIDLDADFLGSILFGLPPLGASADFSLGPVSLFEFSYDLLDVDIGPQFSIGQQFEFVPELWVTMDFSQPVSIGGQEVQSYSMPVGSSIDADFAGIADGQDLDIQTHYSLTNQFHNMTDLRVAPSVDLYALSATIDTFLGTIFDAAVYDPAPIQGPASPIFTIFDQTYSLGGFNTAPGDTLHVDFNRAPEINSGDLLLGSNPIAEGSPLSLTGSFVDPDVGQTHAVTVDWGDGASSTYQLDPGVLTFAASHTYADDAAAPRTVTVAVSDSKGESASAATEVLVINVAPTLDVVGEAHVNEGTPYVVALSSSDPGADTIDHWTINWGDGSEVETVAGDATSANHIYADGPATYSIHAAATDEDGTFDAAAFDVAVDNVAPTVALAGSSFNLDADGNPISFSGVRGQTLDFTGVLTDPGFDNPLAPTPTSETFTFVVDWGDGSPTQGGDAVADSIGSAGVPTIGSFAASHVYAREGVYQVVVTVSDDDGGTTLVTETVTVAVASLQFGGDFAVGGTTGPDSIQFDSGSHCGQIDASMNHTSLGAIAGANRILAFGQSGNDDIMVAGSVGLSAWLSGDEGDDRLKGGAGNDVLLGGAGDDLLIGHQGRDLLVGGEGADRIIGNADDDLLIAGVLQFGNSLPAVSAVMDEWTSDHDYQTRLLNLSGKTEADGNATFADRRNGDNFLLAGQTVIDDDSRDLLTGSSGDDWFFLGLNLDKATDLKDEAFANDLDFINS